ncbi:MAG: Na+/H+ antiporter subunit E [Phycisphaerales bacterium]|nr:Na+/H+ antiporter subunit E [Hyphomonadaceae bacterium]
MLHAAAMLLGLFLIWLAATQSSASAVDISTAAGAALVCTLVMSRAGGAGAAFARAPRALYVAAMHAPAVVAGALATIRAAMAADVTLNPALMRIKTRSNGVERAAFAHLLSATPGMMVVETDADGYLVHVTNEADIDAAELGRLERMVGAQYKDARR